MKRMDNPETNMRINPETNPKIDRINPKTNPEVNQTNPRINPETNTDYSTDDMLSIQDCAKLYNLSTVTIRKWIKKKQLPASIVNNQYLISKNALEKLLEEKGLIQTNPRTNPETNPRTSPDINRINPETNTRINPVELETNLLRELKRENEYLKEKISTLERTISILEQDKEFLQGQVQQLTNTLSLLTTRQLPEPKSFIDKVKGWFRKE